MKILIVGKDTFLSSNLELELKRTNKVASIPADTSKSRLLRAIKNTMPDTEVIINCAEYGIRQYETSNLKSTNINYIATVKLVEALENFNKIKYFIQTSQLTDFYTPYTHCNNMATDYCEKRWNLNESQEIKLVILKFPSQLYGQFDYKDKLIPSLILNSKSRKFTEISKNYKNDFIFVKDISKVIKNIMYSGLSGEFEVGSGMEYSIEDIVNTCKKIGIDLYVRLINTDANVNHLSKSNIDYTNKTLKWKPTPLEKGLRETLSYY